MTIDKKPKRYIQPNDGKKKRIFNHKSFISQIYDEPIEDLLPYNRTLHSD